jgi:purine-binding chemotaxis protein CheW
MPEPAPPATRACRYLTFRLDASLFALPADEVAEVIRLPQVSRVPQAPRALLGVANLRGSVLAVASLSGLLGRGAGDSAAWSRAIVLSGAAPVALAVDAVEALVSIAAEQVETTQAMLAAEPGERLRGGFKVGDDGPVAKVLDIRGLLAAAFEQPVRRGAQPRAGVRADAGPAAASGPAAVGRLVTFEIAGQEYALALECVREIIPLPPAMTPVPRSEALVLGVASYRERLLPLLSLRGLMGFPADPHPDGRARIVVATVRGALVGLVADRMRAILPADPDLIEPTPSILAARAGGETRISAIYRGEAGRRLISILTPETLFREEVMERLSHTRGAVDVSDAAAAQDEAGAQAFLVFRLGADEFGLPIDVVDEVAQVPTQITRIPKTPDFLEGVINLRGEVLPVVDQRRRFDMPRLDAGSRRRLVVVRTAHHRAGLIVDSVSGVLRSEADAIAEAPNLTGEATRLVSGVINLEQAGRMILILDSAELLTRAEREVLDTFAADRTLPGS